MFYKKKKTKIINALLLSMLLNYGNAYANPLDINNNIEFYDRIGYINHDLNNNMVNKSIEFKNLTNYETSLILLFLDQKTSKQPSSDEKVTNELNLLKNEYKEYMKLFLSSNNISEFSTKPVSNTSINSSNTNDSSSESKKTLARNVVNVNGLNLSEEELTDIMNRPDGQKIIASLNNNLLNNTKNEVSDEIPNDSIVEASKASKKNIKDVLADLKKVIFLDGKTEDILEDLKNIKENYFPPEKESVVNIDEKVTNEKEGNFKISGSHELKYVKTKSSGNVPTDEFGKVGADGNLITTTTPQTYELTDTLTISMMAKISKFLDVGINMEAKNENGLLFKNGTSFTFSNLMLDLDLNGLLSKRSKGKVAVRNDQVNTTVKDDKTSVSIGNKDTANGEYNDENLSIIAKVKDGNAVIGAKNENGSIAVDKNGNKSVTVSDGDNGIKVNNDSVTVGHKDKDSSVVVNAKDGNATIGVKDKDGSIIVDKNGNGEIETGKNKIGHTENGGNYGEVTSGKTKVHYEQNKNELELSSDNKLGITFGNFTEKIGNYILNLTDVRGVRVKYKDGDKEGTVLNGSIKYNDEANPLNVERKFKGFSYSQPIKDANIKVGIGYASYDDEPIISNKKTIVGKGSIYGLFFNGGEEENFSYEGEFAFAKTMKDKLNPYYENSKALVFDALKNSGRLMGSLHVINVDKNYKNTKLLQDQFSFNSMAEQSDGNADMPYSNGQKGVDLNLRYVLTEGISNLLFNYSNYSQTENGKALLNWGVGGDLKIEDPNKERQPLYEVNLKTNYEHKKEEGSALRTTWTNNIIADIFPTTNTKINLALQLINDNVEGKERRFSADIKHEFALNNRLFLVPEIEYTQKIKNGGSEIIDMSSLIKKMTLEYDLTGNKELLLDTSISRSKYNIKTPEFDDNGANVDGQSREIKSMGVDLIWKPKTLLEGFTLQGGYSQEQVHYLGSGSYVDGTQHVTNVMSKYAVPIGDNTEASLSYMFENRRDSKNPINNEKTNTSSLNLNTKLKNDTNISIAHSYAEHFKAADPKGTYSSQETTVNLSQHF